MSRRLSDNLNAYRYNLLVDWSNCSRFHRNCLGYRLIATKDWNLYVVDEVDGLMYLYSTGPWDEWIRRIDTSLDELFAYSDRYEPTPLFADGTHLTLEAFLSRI
jgi:hypothetical protein